ncbi:MAG: PEP-CTERM sorting domain-containing protein [Deltaproteobacteria bacterium]|nr:PEP-CTERM sorting domain-containing protein [Deltaproteobacteria bacterium]
MKKVCCCLLCAAVWLASHGMASATPVLFTDWEYTITFGQTFTFTETAMVPSLSGGVFTIMAQGDYDWGDANEYLDWDIDGVVSGTYWGPAYSPQFYDSTAPANDVSWFQTFAISTAQMDAILADDSFTVTITNSNDVEAVQATDFVSYTLQYFDGSTSGPPVPEPTTMLLLGAGLIGLAGLRRKAASRDRG